LSILRENDTSFSFNTDGCLWIVSHPKGKGSSLKEMHRMISQVISATVNVEPPLHDFISSITNSDNPLPDPEASNPKKRKEDDTAIDRPSPRPKMLRFNTENPSAEILEADPPKEAENPSIVVFNEATPISRTKAKLLAKPGDYYKITKYQGKEDRTVLIEWWNSHLPDPVPNRQEKEELAQRNGITLEQVGHWFGNTGRNQRRNPIFSIAAVPDEKEVIAVENVAPVAHPVENIDPKKIRKKIEDPVVEDQLEDDPGDEDSYYLNPMKKTKFIDKNLKSGESLMIFSRKFFFRQAFKVFAKK
jgi:hypothetical protein